MLSLSVIHISAWMRTWALSRRGLLEGTVDRQQSERPTNSAFVLTVWVESATVQVSLAPRLLACMQTGAAGLYVTGLTQSKLGLLGGLTRSKSMIGREKTEDP